MPKLSFQSSCTPLPPNKLLKIPGAELGGKAPGEITIFFQRPWQKCMLPHAGENQNWRLRRADQLSIIFDHCG